MSETVNVVHDYLRRIDKEMTCDNACDLSYRKCRARTVSIFKKSIAENFLSTEPYNEVKRTFKHRKAVRVFVIATVVFALVCVLGYILFDNWRERQFEDGHIVTRLYEEVEGTPPPEPEGTRVY